MGKITDFLEGKIILEEAESIYNGKLTVVKDIAYGTYIRGGGLPQSGGLAEIIWKHTLSGLKKEKPEVKKSLIVGLGGGSIAKLIRSNWPDSKITGVDIDETIVNLGKKYLKLDNSNVEVEIEDAEKFIKKLIKDNKTFDLICFDTYVGENFPSKFESLTFIKQTKNLIDKNGVIIFNRLYGPEDRPSALAFAKTLEKTFASVDRVYPEANIMFVCRN